MCEVDFGYRRLAGEEKGELLNSLRRRLEGVDGILFTYIHGGFIEMEVFRDIDMAVWIKNPADAFSYEVAPHHTLARYGDVRRMVTPREIYRLDDAEKLVEKAQEAFNIARETTEKLASRIRG